jgi:hypothetical protein
MKIKAGTVITRYNGKPVMTDQDIIIHENGQPLIINGMPQMSGGREMTVGDIFSTILSSKKVEQFNVLKADVLASRFYRADIVDVDEADCSALMEVIDHSDVYIPLVLVYAKRALIEAKEGTERVRKAKQSD